MTTIRIPNRAIDADAIDRKWPGAIIACLKAEDDTIVEWSDNSPVSAKTATEIETAQDEWDALPPEKPPMDAEVVWEVLRAKGMVTDADVPADRRQPPRTA